VRNQGLFCPWSDARVATQWHGRKGEPVKAAIQQQELAQQQADRLVPRLRALGIDPEREEELGQV